MAYILVIIVNLLGIVLIRRSSRYWIVCIPIFILLTGYFFIERELNEKEVASLERSYNSESGEMMNGAHDAWLKLKKRQAAAQKFNNLMVNLVLLQSAITLILQIIGWTRTKRMIYRYTTWAFVVVFLILLSFWFMIGIVPSGGIVR